MGFESLAQTADESAGRENTLEEVVVTGTRIRGAEGVVGTAVTQFGEENFQQTAAITVSDMLKTAAPSVLVVPAQTSSEETNRGRNDNINIHGLGGERTLVLVNGARVPMQGWNLSGYDPSIIPSISLERLDLLTAGASATYGSDAVAGVVNMVLRRGFEGAESEFFVSTSGGENLRRRISQLFGTAWDTGGVTVGFEYYDHEAWPASEVGHLIYDFSSFGLTEDHTPINSAMPAIVSTGRPSTPGNGFGRSCQDQTPFPAPFDMNPNANCYSVPAGSGWDFGTQAPGPTVDWGTVLANDNVDNLFNPWEFADYVGDNQRTAFTVTFDQRITDSVEAFADMYYSDRSSNFVYQNHIVNWAAGAFTLPILNPADYPYTPTGSPSDLMVSYSTQAELNGPVQNSDEEASRIAVGLNIDGPGEWSTRVFYGVTQNDVDMDLLKTANQNNINAALGNLVFDGLGRYAPYVIGNDPARTVTAGDLAGQPPNVQAAYPVGTPVRVINPSSVPFLNVFCDPRVYQCNDPRTIAFIGGYDNFNTLYEVREAEVTSTGPLFEIPGGTVEVAVGASFTDERFNVTREINFTSISTEFPGIYHEGYNRDFSSVFGEMRFPIFSEQNARAGLRKLDLQLSARHDDYNDFGGTTNSQFGVSWEPADGLTIRANGGTSFRAPTFTNLTDLSGGTVSVFGVGASGRPPSSRFRVCTSQQAAQAAQPTPGSFAEEVINAIGAADCSDAAIMSRFNAILADPSNPFYSSAATAGGDAANFVTNIRLPGLMAITGGVGGIVGLTDLHPEGYALQPEKSDSRSLGFDYAPPFADGRLTFGLTYFEHDLEDLISSVASAFADYLNDPAASNTFTMPADPNYPALYDFFVSHPLMTSAVNLAGVSTLWDAKTINIGTREVAGIDYSAGYEWDTDRYTWNVGLIGTYMIRDEQQVGVGGQNIYESLIPALEGLPTLPRTRLRWELGFRNGNGFNAGLFLNYQSRYYSTLNFPAFAGSDDRGKVPSHYTYDLMIAYGTEERPRSDLFRNLELRLTMLNVTDRDPPFFYNSELTGGTTGAIDQVMFNDFGRTVSLSATKSW